MGNVSSWVGNNIEGDVVIVIYVQLNEDIHDEIKFYVGLLFFFLFYDRIKKIK